MSGLQEKLCAAESAIRDLFPWPRESPCAVRRRGDQERLAPLFDHFGLFFEEERAGQRVSTALHPFAGKSAGAIDISRENVAASAMSSGVCSNRACPARGGEVVKALSVCSKCRYVAYCGVSCQREDWPAHRAWCKRTTTQHADSSSTSVTIDDGSLSFARAATAAVIGASGPIAMLAWIWRSKAGYKGEIPTGLLPPIVLVELADSDSTAWQPPIAMRVSELLDPLICDGIPQMYVRLVMDREPGGLGAQIRSGERVMCIVTTPARDPRRIKALSLAHCVPLPLLARKFKMIERAAEGDDSTYGVPVLEAHYIIARPVLGDDEALLFGARAEEDMLSDDKVDRAFCNLQHAVGHGPHATSARVHAVLVSDCEITMTVRR